MGGEDAFLAIPFRDLLSISSTKWGKKMSARSVGTWELASSHHYQCADGLVYGWYLLYLARELPVHNSSFYFDFR